MRIFAVCLLVMTVAVLGAQGGAVKAKKAPVKPKFEQTAKPFFAKNCVSCHTGAKAAGKVDLSAVKTEADAKAKLKMMKKAWHEVEEGAMPPKGSPKPTAAEKAKFASWIKAQPK